MRLADMYDGQDTRSFEERRAEVGVDVGVGHGQAVMWTCDLTKAYEAINGDYRS